MLLILHKQEQYCLERVTLPSYIFIALLFCQNCRGVGGEMTGDVA